MCSYQCMLFLDEKINDKKKEKAIINKCKKHQINETGFKIQHPKELKKSLEKCKNINKKAYVGQTVHFKRGRR